MRQIFVSFASDNYNHWAKLCWKKQMEGNLTEEEQKGLERLKIEEHGTIEEAYNSLENKKKSRNG